MDKCQFKDLSSNFNKDRYFIGVGETLIAHLLNQRVKQSSVCNRNAQFLAP